MNLRLQDIEKRYGGQAVLSEFSLAIEGARCLAFIGPSGGGKSTALRLVGGLEAPSKGKLTVNGRALSQGQRELRSYRRQIGMVFQAYNLFPHLSALENIVLPLVRVHGQSTGEARERGIALLQRFKLAEHADKRPAALSGGQAQRVAIARSIAHNPRLVLLDEPTSALDPDMSAEVLDLIEELVNCGTDCIIVTHQMGFAKRASDAVAFIADGRVVEAGPSRELFTHPAHEQVSRFIDRELRY